MKIVFTFIIISLCLNSCNNEKSHWSLPLGYENYAIIKEIDSLLSISGESNTKDSKIDVKINSQYRLKGALDENGRKTDWWEFTGKNDSLLMEIIDLGNEEFINQNIYINNGKIDRNLSKYYSIKKKVIDEDSLLYHLDYYVPYAKDGINDFMLSYVVAPSKNSQVRNEVPGEIKNGRLQFEFNVDYKKYKDSLIFCSPFLSIFFEDEGINILQSFVTDTIRPN